MLTNIGAFFLTLLRFKQAPRKQAYLFAMLTLALSACGVYRAPSGAALYQFTLWFMFYIAAAGAMATLVATFVTPTPSGRGPWHLACQAWSCKSSLWRTSSPDSFV